MVRLTDRSDMTLDVYRGRKTTMQQQQQNQRCWLLSLLVAERGRSAERTFQYILNPRCHSVTHRNEEKYVSNYLRVDPTVFLCCRELNCPFLEQTFFF